MCVTCGSLAQCPHDLEDEPENTLIASEGAGDIPAMQHLGAGPSTQRRRSTQASAASAAGAEPVSRSACADAGTSPPARPEETDTCDMVANRAVAPGTEVFNTYGEQLANAQLLARYGFALDGNEHDTVAFAPADLPIVAQGPAPGRAVERAALLRTFQRTLALFPRCAQWAASGFVYQPEGGPSGSAQADSEDGLEQQPRAHPRAAPMVINSDAKISHALWLYCAVASMLESWGPLAQDPDAGAVAVAARRLARSQLALEGRAEGASSADSEANAYDDEGRGDRLCCDGESDKVCFILRGARLNFRVLLLAGA